MVGIPDTITDANLGDDWLRGLGMIGNKLPFSRRLSMLSLHHSRSTMRVCDNTTSNCLIINFCHTVVVVWRNGITLASINKVNPRRARLVLGWVTVSVFDSRGDTLLQYVTSHPGRVGLLPSVGR